MSHSIKTRIPQRHLTASRFLPVSVASHALCSYFVFSYIKNFTFQLLCCLGFWVQIPLCMWHNRMTELLSHSQAKLGQGSPDCQQMHEKIIEQFKDNVLECTVATNLGISSTTVHNIVKRFRQFGEITACKLKVRKQTWMPTNFDPQMELHQKASLCKRYRHMGSGTFQKTYVSKYSLMLHSIVKLKILLWKAKAIYQRPETLPASLGPSSSGMVWCKVEKCSVVFCKLCMLPPG